MENETQKIFEEQVLKLPNAVVSFLASSTWNEELEGIGSMYNLAPEQLSSYKQEVALVLAGLVHPNEFSKTLAGEVGLQGSVLEAIVSATEQKVFATVRHALVDFFEHEEELPQETAPVAAVAPQQNTAPANLPTAPEPEHLIPPIPAKVVPLAPAPEPMPVHPFEEKMKRVLTAGESSLGKVVLEQATAVIPPPEQPAVPSPAIPPQGAPSVYIADTTMPKPSAQAPAVEKFTAPASTTTRVYRADPYREPIE